MSDIVESNVIEIGTEVKHEPLEYIYMTIPAEYICVYHRILAMLADYGIEMLKDCKATCKDRNSGVIECFNMFNAAVAARKLGAGDPNSPYTKEAATLIKYIKAKINQIYKGKDNSTSFVFPVDENGQLKAFVSCNDRPLFYINPDDGQLYDHKFHKGFDEHFRLGEEDYSDGQVLPSPSSEALSTNIPENELLSVSIFPRYEYIGNEYRPCADIFATYAGNQLDINNIDRQYYFDDVLVQRFNDVVNLQEGVHVFECVINYNNLTAIDRKYLRYSKY